MIFCKILLFGCRTKMTEMNDLDDKKHSNARGKLIKLARQEGWFFLIILLKFFYYRMFNVSILASSNVSIRGLKNIFCEGILRIGLENTGFTHRSDRTVLNIKGRLFINKDFSIGKGCRIDIGPEAQVKIGRGGYINSFTKMIISNRLMIGRQCAIAWNCQFLDNDFHTLKVDGRAKASTAGIKIGDHVWIGCNVIILKGVEIPNNSIVAANSVVTGKFYEENVLIAGNPARVIKRNVNWG